MEQLERNDSQEEEILRERFELAKGRIEEIVQETKKDNGNSLWNESVDNVDSYREYFEKGAAFLLLLIEYSNQMAGKKVFTHSLEECQEMNKALYEDVLEANYAASYGNPAYACERLGEKLGSILCVLYAELRGGIFHAAQEDLEQLLIRMELFIEVYSAFTTSMADDKILPQDKTLQQIVYWYVSDYSEVAIQNSVEQMLLPGKNICEDIICNTDLQDLRGLYAYGEYVNDSQLKMAAYMNQLPQEKIDLMANTFTEGYRIGFELGNKDLSKKKTAEIRYALGFERMMKKAIENLAVLHLKPVIRRSPMGLLENGGMVKLGPVGANPNRQYDFDHKDDKALIFDKALLQRKLEIYRTVFEHLKAAARDYAGPAVLETFGEKDFDPVFCKEAAKLSAAQQKLWVEYRTGVGEIQRQYILEEERSFTIIAFPVPEIGENFEAIFDDIIAINTLDYMKYRNIQQRMIDTLDLADYVEIKGMNGNRTDLKVNLYKLTDPSKETIFENCVADVNIPVGEVFTSPVLKGTTGILHVSRVFLNGLEYRDLELHFEDGMIAGYHCSNFESEEENLKFIKENVLFHRDTLPMGEFAIGTNTTAYTCARKWGIESKMPILIDEKTGPHFAVGDTCYSHAEEIKVYNPDGKEIVARENEQSMKRKEDPKTGYFDCHTDITIPYDELKEIIAVTKEGQRIPIIAEGRFVLPGTEELNEALV